MKLSCLILAFGLSVSPIITGQKVTPPLLNTVPVHAPYLHISKTEVSNIQYREFLYYLKTQNMPEAHRKNLPDTLCWRVKLAYKEPYTDYYFRHPAYNNYPVVGVSYEQATAFCEWLTGLWNESLEHSEIAKVIVRLPTESEWEAAAYGTFDTTVAFPWGHNGMRQIHKKFKGQIHANFIRGHGDYLGVAGNLNANADVTAPVESYWPNSIGIYNMSGNVAEFVKDQKITKGGSWRSTGYYLRINSTELWETETGSSPTTGFRYVIEVVELKQTTRKKDISISADWLEKGVTAINDSLFAGKFEVTNRLYNLFLQENPSDTFKVENANWNWYEPYHFYHMYGWHARYDDYPVVNISYESALAFCKWLTGKYNNSPKRKHRNVVFRLPSETEWQTMAAGGLEHSPYPWGGPYLRNAKACFLCNFNPDVTGWAKLDSSGRIYYDYPNGDTLMGSDMDGSKYPLPVDSYLPNGYGLYNCAGNVSEMVIEKGTCKGGSWTSSGRMVRIDSRETYNGPDPRVGFRYLMVIID